MSEVDTQLLLRLRNLELALVKAATRLPDALSQDQFARLRYALNLASLTRFQPGAAQTGRRNDRSDIQVPAPLVNNLRSVVFHYLRDPLTHHDIDSHTLTECAEALDRLWPQVVQTRSRILEYHINDFSAQELDTEIGTKQMISVAGGGGGAGYVYAGAYWRLQEAGVVPSLVIGSSIGSLIGLVRARRVNADFEEYMTLAKSLSPRRIFKRVSLAGRHSVPGLLRLHLRDALAPIVVDDNGRSINLSETEIPYSAVISGVRRNVAGKLLVKMRQPESRWGRQRPFSLRVAERMWQTTAFFAPRLVKEVTLGFDPLTTQFNAIDAVGFSAAIPGVLQYEIPDDDTRMLDIATRLCQQRGLVALVDGGVANNVPARNAWRQVQEGRIGTRNAFYLGFDCFHPQLTGKHLWLWPIAKFIQMQMLVHRPYLGHLIQFRPTLSPVNLLPHADGLDMATQWGRDQMEQELPFIRAMLKPFPWPEARAERAA